MSQSEEKNDKKKLTPEQEVKQLEAKMKEIQKQATARKKRLAKKRMKLMAESADDYKKQVLDLKNQLKEAKAETENIRVEATKLSDRVDSYKKSYNRLKQISEVFDENLVMIDDKRFDEVLTIMLDASQRAKQELKSQRRVKPKSNGNNQNRKKKNNL